MLSKATQQQLSLRLEAYNEALRRAGRDGTALTIDTLSDRYIAGKGLPTAKRLEQIDRFLIHTLDRHGVPKSGFSTAKELVAARRTQTAEPANATTRSDDPPALPSLDCALIAARFLRNQDFGTDIAAALTIIRHYSRQATPPGRQGRQRDLYRAGAKAATRLLEIMDQLDPLPLAHRAAPPGAHLPRHAAARRWTLLHGALEGVISDFMEAARAARPARHRPNTPDPISFAVETLAAIWQTAGKSRPNGSRNRGGFADFVEAVLADPSLNFPAPGITTAINNFLYQSKH